MIEQFIENWYKCVDGHATVSQLTVLIIGQGLLVNFPGKEMDFDSYVEWYKSDTQTFFDGKHTINSMKIEIQDNRAIAFMEITWNARKRISPNACSESICLLPNVTMTLVPDEQGENLLLARYDVVDRILS